MWYSRNIYMFWSFLEINPDGLLEMLAHFSCKFFRLPATKKVIQLLGLHPLVSVVALLLYSHSPMSRAPLGGIVNF